MDKEILTIAEAAGYLQMGKRSLYKLAKSGKIPHRKILNKYRFEKETLRQWVIKGGRIKQSGKKCKISGWSRRGIDEKIPGLVDQLLRRRAGIYQGLKASSSDTGHRFFQGFELCMAPALACSQGIQREASPMGNGKTSLGRTVISCRQAPSENIPSLPQRCINLWQRWGLYRFPVNPLRPCL